MIPAPPEPPQRPPAGPRALTTRTTLVVALAVAVLGIAAIGALIVHLTSQSAALPAGAVPGVIQTPAPGACVDTAQARTVWNDVTQRLDALSLHPDVAKVGTVAEGTAAQQISQYLQQTLLDKHLTERERERLDSVTVVQPGCNGQPLTLHLTETLVQDDYLAPDGHVDHVDSSVGQRIELLESYVRSGGVWKVVSIANLAQPTDSGNIV